MESDLPLGWRNKEKVEAAWKSVISQIAFIMYEQKTKHNY